MNIEPLLDLLTTQNDRKRLIDFLEMVSHSFFRTHENSRVLIESNKEFGQALLSILSTELESENPTIISKQIADIINEINEIPMTKVILAKSPTPESITEVKKFMDENLPDKSIMDISVDPEILGGAIIISKGKYIDMSVAKKLIDTFTKDHGAIGKILDI